MSQIRPQIPRWAWPTIALGLIAAVVFLPRLVSDLRATQGAVAAFVEMIAAANLGDLDRVRAHCSARYLAAHPLDAAKEGGVVGLPRNIHKNFQAWREGQDVWLCPTNRVGPVYRFVREADAWKFDGPAGVLRPGGRVVAGEGDPMP